MRRTAYVLTQLRVPIASLFGQKPVRPRTLEPGAFSLPDIVRCVRVLDAVSLAMPLTPASCSP
jgi:hypothetical protein